MDYLCKDKGITLTIEQEAKQMNEEIVKYVWSSHTKLGDFYCIQKRDDLKESPGF